MHGKRVGQFPFPPGSTAVATPPGSHGTRPRADPQRRFGPLQEIRGSERLRAVARHGPRARRIARALRAHPSLPGLQDGQIAEGDLDEHRHAASDAAAEEAAEDAPGEVEAETDGETGQGEAMTDTERADEAVAGADEVLIGANRSVQVGTQAQGGSEEVSSACSWSVDHGHRAEVAEQSVPTRRGAFAGWDAQGGELPYRRLLGDELAGDVVRPRPRRAWWSANCICIGRVK